MRLLVVVVLAAQLRVGCDCGGTAPPETAGLSLKDPVTGSKTTLTQQPAGLEITGDSRAQAWCVGESAQQPALDDACWVRERPTQARLSPGDGTKTLRLWVRDRYSTNVRGAEATITVTGSPPPITFDAVPSVISFSRQAQTRFSGTCIVGGVVALADVGTTPCDATGRWALVADLTAAADGPLSVSGTQEVATLISPPAMKSVTKDTQACASAAARAGTPFASGAGTVASPLVVCTAEQLLAVASRLDAHVQLRDDVDVSAAEWAGLGDFAGTFDGKGFVVRGLRIVTARPYAGLFARVTGTIRRLTVADVNLAAGDYSGALVGYLDTDGAVIDCHASGVIDTSSVHVGGLIGQSHGDVTDSDASVAITGSGYAVGGLIGHAYAGTIRRCFATGTVEAKGGCGAGLIGRNETAVIDSYATSPVDCGGAGMCGGIIGEMIMGTLDRCHSVGKVVGGSDVGGATGVNNGTLTATYWNVDSSQVATSPGGTGLTAAQMVTPAAFVGWDFDTVWRMDARHPVLRR